MPRRFELAVLLHRNLADLTKQGTNHAPLQEGKSLNMNFSEAIAVHSQWKTKLSSYLAHPDHSLNPREVALSDKCALGQWIAGEGHKYAKLPEFAKLTEEHARFHKAAADIIIKADRGQNVSGEVALGAHSEFGDASTGVVKAIMEMERKA